MRILLADVLERGLLIGSVRWCERPRPAWLDAALAMIERDVADPGLDVERLARRAHLSTSQFSLRFRDAMGLPPKAFLLRRRLALAQALLVAGEMPVKAVARLCGFSDPFHFSRQFARALGRPPSAWRLAPMPNT
ncbi:MAG: helix-turn-helix transcriptional regulator [Planctomycetes bacterium]|nr:helix-turn-helix transcriptional regulator [Planctomycetota bacterium]